MDNSSPMGNYTASLMPQTNERINPFRINITEKLSCLPL